MKVLIIGAHCDDEVFGAGGTIAKYVRSGRQVFIHLLGEGTAKRYGEGGPERIKKQAKSCASILGVPEENLSFGGFLYGHKEGKDGVLEIEHFDERNFTKLVVHLEKIIGKIQPDEIFTHWKGDANTDHGYVYRAVEKVVRPISLAGKSVKKVLCFETISSTDQSFQEGDGVFRPNFFVDISNWLDFKIRAALEYTTEIKPWPHPRSEKGIRASAQTRGMASGLEAAEAFMLMREIC